MVNIVSDRGSNFVKGFQDFDPLYCFGHRLNNVVKRSFFQHMQKKNKQSNSTIINDVTAGSHGHPASKSSKDAVTNLNDALSSEDSSEDDEEYVRTSLPIIRKRKSSTSKTTTDDQQLPHKVPLEDIPSEARNVLSTLKQCKKIVKYIKKVNMVTFGLSFPKQTIYLCKIHSRAV